MGVYTSSRRHDTKKLRKENNLDPKTKRSSIYFSPSKPILCINMYSHGFSTKKKQTKPYQTVKGTQKKPTKHHPPGRLTSPATSKGKASPSSANGAVKALKSLTWQQLRLFRREVD